jgi:sentrin-specific protease 1
LQEEEEVDDELVEVADDEHDDGFTLTEANHASWRIVFNRPWAKETKVLVDVRQQQVTRKQLLCMDYGTWLNDEAINTYCVLMQERDTLMRHNPPGTLDHPPPPCNFFSSFFLTQLFMNDGKYNYGNVQKWTIPRKLETNGLDLEGFSNIFDLDLLLFPANINNAHWSLAVIDLKKQEFVYYDSMGGNAEGMDILNHLAQWLQDESINKRGVQIDVSGWKRIFPSDIPKQVNGYDCGLFTLMYADRLGMGLPFEFNQDQMDAIRVKVLHRLMAKRVPLWPTP